MFSISVETSFMASHQLILPGGSKEPSHQHTWMVTAEVGRNNLSRMGLVMNFHRLRSLVDEIISEFDGAALEKISYFQHNNPSAENVAKYIYDKLKPKLSKSVKLLSIAVLEEAGCSAKFSE
jgi:6-pyruvoyltetrahydropterin/6-carboxytetrahydropterin synthase